MSAGIGHNSTSSELIIEICEKCEKLIEERATINETIKAVLDGAEASGLDKKTLREMIRLRAMDKQDRDEREELRELYKASIGIV